MSPYLKEELLEYNNEIGQSYPCSNQIVCRAIIYSSLDKLESFIKSKNGYQTSRLLNTYNINGETWKAVRVPNNARGLRFYKVYIEEDIKDEYIYNTILPYMSMYCNFVEFF